MGDPSEPSSGLKRGKGLWNSTDLYSPQTPARLASSTDMYSPFPPPPPPHTVEPGPRLNHALMCRQCNLTMANLHFAAHLNIGA